MKKTKQEEKKFLKKLESELKSIEKSTGEYGSPTPPPPNSGLTLEYSNNNLILLRNKDGTFYRIKHCVDGVVLEKLKVV